VIDITKLLLSVSSQMEELRYGDKGHPIKERDPEKQCPIVVWNLTLSCNLRCLHCYTRSDEQTHQCEMSTEQGKALIKNLAEFGVPVLLFSGGEPLMRKDLLDLASYAVSLGIRTVLSTNGTMIDNHKAQALKDNGFSYVGVSLDGLKNNHDHFRQSDGAFEKALKGIRNCLEVGLKVGLRFTITKGNADDVLPVFDILKKEGIPRVCFYHLAYAGRGTELMEEDLAPEDTRFLIEKIIDLTAKMHQEGFPIQVLTVANHADGPFLYLKMKRENNKRAQRVMDLLTINGGNRTGVGIASVGWDGTVYPDQFWRTHPLGNVLDKPFGDIWTDMSHPLLGKLKHKKKYITGRCSLCKFLDICGGNLRVRAESVTGDVWASDPACYLSDEEIGIV